MKIEKKCTKKKDKNYQKIKTFATVITKIDEGMRNKTNEINTSHSITN